MAIEKGDKVKIEYEGKLDDGQVFDSTQGQPLEFTVGEGKIIPGFENNVVGMEKEEEKDITVSPDEAYGQKKEGMEKEVPRDSLPEGQEPQEGMIITVSTPDGKQFPATISEVQEDKIKIDLNHPLAGKNLYFHIKVSDFEKQPEQTQESEESSEESQGEENLEDMASEEKQE